MYMYIWNHADYTTDNYHEEAGVVIIAETLKIARILARNSEKIEPDSEIYTKNPDEDIYLAVQNVQTKSSVWVFPNAECC